MRDIDRENTNKNEWLDSPHTQVLLENGRKQLEYKLQDLHVACRESTDPKVVAAYHKWGTAFNMVKMLEEGEGVHV